MEEILIPINGCVLVELKDNLEYIDLPDKQFNTKQSGIVRNVDSQSEDYHYLIEKTVYFEEYRDSAQVEVDDKKYAFIKIEDIRGYASE